MLDLPHMAPLKAYAAHLRQQSSGVEVPDFDPLDGGIQARALFLFEKPGPMTSESGKRAGSGFISRNNNDETAASTFVFLRQAAIPRTETILWNLIPWWNGTRKVTRQERLAGLATIDELCGLLPALKVVVLVGRIAGRAADHFSSRGLPVLTSAHPSPLVKAASLSKWQSIPEEWAKVHEHLTGVERG